MKTRKIDLKLVGIALLPALAVSVGVILLGKAAGFPDAVAERVSQILFFPVFFGSSAENSLGWSRRESPFARRRSDIGSQPTLAGAIMSRRG